MIIIEDIKRTNTVPEQFKKRMQNMQKHTITIIVPDFSEREEPIEETIEHIWEAFDLDEKLYVLEKAGYPLI